MNKLELVQAVKEKSQITKKDASSVVYLFFDEMADALAGGE